MAHNILWTTEFVQMLTKWMKQPTHCLFIVSSPTNNRFLCVQKDFINGAITKVTLFASIYRLSYDQTTLIDEWSKKWARCDCTDSSVNVCAFSKGLTQTDFSLCHKTRRAGVDPSYWISLTLIHRARRTNFKGTLVAAAFKLKMIIIYVAWDSRILFVGRTKDNKMQLCVQRTVQMCQMLRTTVWNYVWNARS